MDIRICLHPNFMEEFEKLRSKYSSKVREQLGIDFENGLLKLQEAGRKIIVRPDFEQLSSRALELYSWKLKKGKPNIRILFAFLDDYTIVMLTAFYEKEQSDYNRAIERAKRRLRDFYEGIIVC